MISKLLSGAVKLYLRSQVARAEDLQVRIVGRSKQILTGYIPQVFIGCNRAIYQGLYLSQIQIRGTDIAINLSEVIKKKPLRLIEPILIEIQLVLDETDLMASLGSNLLQSGLSDLWELILATQDFTQFANLTVEWSSMAIKQQNLHLTGIYQNASGETKKLVLVTGVNLVNSNTLCLSPLSIIRDSLEDSLEHQLKIDLGTDVNLEELTIESQGLVCSGKIRVNS